MQGKIEKKKVKKPTTDVLRTKYNLNNVLVQRTVCAVKCIELQCSLAADTGGLMH